MLNDFKNKWDQIDKQQRFKAFLKSKAKKVIEELRALLASKSLRFKFNSFEMGDVIAYDCTLRANAIER